MVQTYPINSLVQLRITRCIPSGLLGTVDDALRAIVRSREISWEEPLPFEHYIGQTLSAVVIGFNDAYDELELSLRLARRDPWKESMWPYRVRCEARGQVVGLIDAGVFVELEPGVEAFLPRSEMPLGVDERVDSWFWIGDHVRGVIIDCDYASRRLRLSLSRLLDDREEAMQRQMWHPEPQVSGSRATMAELLPPQVRQKLLRIGDEESPAPRSVVLSALIIEDDATYGAGLQDLFQRNACQVEWAQDGASGVAYAQSRPFDLILVDWNLPGLKGHEIVEQLRENPARLVMLFEPAPLQQHPDIWESLKDDSIDMLSKADSAHCQSELLDILRELRGGVVRLGKRRRPVMSIPAVLSGGSSSSFEGDAMASRARGGFQALLSRLQRQTQATSVALLYTDPAQPRPLIEESVGIRFPIEQAGPDLMFSPLGDVLLRDTEVMDQAASGSSRFARLVAMLPFEGFLGVPLPIVDSWHYGLMLLKQTGAFGDQDRQEVSWIAPLISAGLQERRLLGALQPWQAQNLAGQLTSMVVHEINNKLGGMRYQIDTIQKGLQELARYPVRAGDITFITRMEKAIDGISMAQEEASRLRNRYLGLGAIDQVGSVDIGALVAEMGALLRTEAQSHNTSLTCETAKQRLMVQARPSQLRQVLLNLILNAIQQMGRIKREGRVIVSVEHQPQNALPIQVRISDDGPGIHWQLWGQIFDFGFTTRKGGAGLGLTIARAIVSELGGRLHVEDSCILFGTAFLVELPGEVQDE